MTMFQLNRINRHSRSFDMQSLFLLLRILLVTFPMVTGKFHSSGSSSQEKQAQRFAMEPQVSKSNWMKEFERSLSFVWTGSNSDYWVKSDAAVPRDRQDWVDSVDERRLWARRAQESERLRPVLDGREWWRGRLLAWHLTHNARRRCTISVPS